MSYDSNIYYHPEKHGLTVIDSLEHSSGFYEFDTHIAWVHTDGRVFLAHDSGCSCPTPFENYESLDDLTQVTSENLDEIEKAVMEKAYSEADQVSKLEFILKIKDALKKGGTN